MHISVVSPVYKAPSILPELVDRLIIALTKITNSFEIILVDDGCPINSWAIVEELSNKHCFVRGIKLSRNFGQHYAITAGLDQAKGKWVVVMDCDLQDQPEEIQKLYDKTIIGYDCVLAARENRQDSLIKKIFSNAFYRILSELTGAKYDHRVANFGIYSQKVIQSINQFREPIRYFPGLVQYVGFKSETINIEHASRKEGKSSYNFKRLTNLALDIILAYSDKPLRIIIKLGLLISLLSFFYVGFSIWQWYTDQILVPGYTSLIASVWLLSGILISTLGIIGLYLGKTFEAVKSRPIYIISNTLN
jgi:glycosyltransferase involved in cell wall biosynthesis